MQHIKSGLRPAELAKRLGISKTALQYHLTKLKQAGAMTKIGYGVWEVSDTAILEQKRSTNLPWVGKAAAGGGGGGGGGGWWDGGGRGCGWGGGVGAT